MSKAKQAPAPVDQKSAEAPAVEGENLPVEVSPIGQDVAAFEASLAAKSAVEASRGCVNHVDLINADTRGVLVLFPYVPTSPAPGVEYPVMKGNLDTRSVKVPVSAFLKSTDEGRHYLSLSIGVSGQSHIGGAVFRQEVQSTLDGRWDFVPGKENERFGSISKTQKIGDFDYETVFQLNFSGKRRLSGAGVPYIKGNVYPVRKEDAEATPDMAMLGCF